MNNGVLFFKFIITENCISTTSPEEPLHRDEWVVHFYVIVIS